MEGTVPGGEGTCAPPVASLLINHPGVRASPLGTQTRAALVISQGLERYTGQGQRSALTALEAARSERSICSKADPL